MIIYSRTSLAQDNDGNVTKLNAVGPNSDQLRTYDQNTQQLLEGIYNQLKVLNFQMATITENSIEEILGE
jgi:hypothetical protein